MEKIRSQLPQVQDNRYSHNDPERVKRQNKIPDSRRKRAQLPDLGTETLPQQKGSNS